MYHYCTTPMTESDVKACKQIAQKRGFDFEFAHLTPPKFCFWVSNSYGGAISKSEGLPEVLADIAAAGIILPEVTAPEQRSA